VSDLIDLSLFALAVSPCFSGVSQPRVRLDGGEAGEHWPPGPFIGSHGFSSFHNDVKLSTDTEFDLALGDTHTMRAPPLLQDLRLGPRFPHLRDGSVIDAVEIHFFDRLHVLLLGF